MENSNFQGKGLYYIVNPDDKYLLGQETNKISSMLGNKNGGIYNFITPYELRELQKQGLELDEQVQQGDIIVSVGKSYYSKLRTDENIEKLLKQKIMAIGMICSLLGAQDFVAKNYAELLNNSSEDTSFGGDIQAIRGSIDGEYNKNTNHNNLNQAAIETSIKTTGILTEESYQQAKIIAYRYNLHNDDLISLIFKLRNPSKPQLIKQTYKINILHEIKDEVDLAVSISSNLPSLVGGLNINTNFKNTKNTIDRYKQEFEFEVDFGGVQTPFAPIATETKPQLGQGNEENQNVEILLEQLKCLSQGMETIKEEYNKSIKQVENNFNKQLSDSLSGFELKLNNLNNKVETANELNNSNLESLNNKIEKRFSNIDINISSTISEFNKRFKDIDNNIKTINDNLFVLSDRIQKIEIYNQQLESYKLTQKSTIRKCIITISIIGAISIINVLYVIFNFIKL